MAYLTHCRVMATLILVTLFQKSGQSPTGDMDAYGKAAYKSGEKIDLPGVLTLDIIKTKLKNSGIFDWTDPSLTAEEKENIRRLFDTLEIVISARNRQPDSAQNMFASMGLVEKTIKKQLKEGYISDSLANKFHWDAVLPSTWKNDNSASQKQEKFYNLRYHNTLL